MAEQLNHALNAALGAAPGFRVLERAAADGVIADRPDAAIAVLDPKYAVTQDEDGSLSGKAAIDQLWERAGGGFRQWRNALLLVAPEAELWKRADDAMREVMAYEGVIAEIEKGRIEVSQVELKDLKARFNDKKESLRTSIVTAYRWVLYPSEDGLATLSLPVPATKDERVAKRVFDRLSDQDYGQPKILTRMGAVYFNSKIVPQLWKDEAAPLELGEASRRFPQWTFLPILPTRDETLRACIREGLRDKLWGVAIGDASLLKFRVLIELPEQLDDAITLFDGSASLVKGEVLDLVREELRQKDETNQPEPVRPQPGKNPESPYSPPQGGATAIPAPPRRHSRLVLRIERLGIGKTGNLQPYLFKVLQEQDAGAEIALSIDVTSSAGISEEALKERIIQAFDQLGIQVDWEPR